nr:hypothetical protein CVCH_041 [Cavernulicola chilensis]
MNNKTVELKELMLRNETSQTELRQIIRAIEEDFNKNFINLFEILEFLYEKKNYNKLSPNYLNVYIFCLLKRSTSLELQKALKKFFPKEFVTSLTSNSYDYSVLESSLCQGNFFEADQLTQSLLCKLAGEKSQKRQWLYFTEVKQIKPEKLKDINLLWDLYSQGKFGIAIQRKLWFSLNKNWYEFWKEIGWINNLNWLRYPSEFTWGLEAPRGHLPLFNQLRGVQVLEALFLHAAWEEDSASRY